MGKPISRREVLENIVFAGAGALLQAASAPSVSAQKAGIPVAGKPVEFAISSVSSYTVRITFSPIENSQPKQVPDDGSLVKQDWGAPRLRLRSPASPATARLGNLTAKVTPDPLTIAVDDKDGRPVQQLR